MATTHSVDFPVGSALKSPHLSDEILARLRDLSAPAQEGGQDAVLSLGKLFDWPTVTPMLVRTAPLGWGKRPEVDLEGLEILVWNAHSPYRGWSRHGTRPQGNRFEWSTEAALRMDRGGRPRRPPTFSQQCNSSRPSQKTVPGSHVGSGMISWPSAPCEPWPSRVTRKSLASSFHRQGRSLGQGQVTCSRDPPCDPVDHTCDPATVWGGHSSGISIALTSPTQGRITRAGSHPGSDREGHATLPW